MSMRPYKPGSLTEIDTPTSAAAAGSAAAAASIRATRGCFIVGDVS